MDLQMADVADRADVTVAGYLVNFGRYLRILECRVDG